MEDAERLIQVTVNAGKNCRLENNKKKINIIIFSKKDKPESIVGIEVVNNMITEIVLKIIKNK